MKDIDIDALIELERGLRNSAGPTDPQERVAKLVEVLRDLPIHVTSVNAVSLDSEEQEAMNHLLAVMKQIKTWFPVTNHDELVTGVHTIQGFIIQHMLHRLNPDQWSDWSREQ